MSNRPVSILSDGHLTTHEDGRPTRQQYLTLLALAHEGNVLDQAVVEVHMDLPRSRAYLTDLHGPGETIRRYTACQSCDIKQISGFDPETAQTPWQPECIDCRDTGWVFQRAITAPTDSIAFDGSPMF